MPLSDPMNWIAWLSCSISVIFWDRIKGDYIQDQKLAEFLYDYYVHSGARAIKKVQNLAGVADDGIFGNITLRAINNTDPVRLFQDLKTERRNFLTSLSKQSGQAKFLKGWMHRINTYM
ncbi:MAG: hypothetical protein KL787_08855 [Taibaiella sp.]|nr:hypothetical protein [Taibaiella sp.]